SIKPMKPYTNGDVNSRAANNGVTMHLIEQIGFDYEEKKLRSAGMDYHDLSRVERYPDFNAFKAAMGDRAIYAITTKGTRSYAEVQYQPGDVLLFGSETSGLAPDVMAQIAPEQRIRIPMMPNNRSLNLSNSVAIVSYEAWRQQGFPDGS